MTRGILLLCLTTVCAVAALGTSSNAADRHPELAAWSAETPTDDMLLWLRADRVGTLDESNGVERWENHAPGTPRHAMQSEAERRPRWVSPVETLGGRAVLVFDG